MNNQHRIALTSMRLLATTLRAGLVTVILWGTSALAGVSIVIDPFAIAQRIQQASQSTPGPAYRSKPTATSPAAISTRTAASTPPNAARPFSAPARNAKWIGRAHATAVARARRDQLLSADMTSPNSSQVSPLKRASWTAWMG